MLCLSWHLRTERVFCPTISQPKVVQMGLYTLEELTHSLGIAISICKELGIGQHRLFVYALLPLL